MPTFFEFFAGGGMARAGLGPKWKCLFANDFDRKKGATYEENWGKGPLVVDDIRNLSSHDMTGVPDLVWGSFPCQDLSLAGGGAGLRGDRSGTYWPFISHLTTLIMEQRAPKIIAVENVVGTLTSHSGSDFIAICRSLVSLGYLVSALIVDAALFLPQSRPRLFVIAVRSDCKHSLSVDGPRTPWHTTALRRAVSSLPLDLREKWFWLDLPTPPKRQYDFADIIEENPTGVRWHSKIETQTLISMMSDVNLAKVKTAQVAKTRMVGAVYKRTRFQQGIKVQRAEVRFDDVAGCLRTPAGGSSRQLIIVVEGENVRSRLISARETARLMGLSDKYKLPGPYNEAYHLTGDGVAVPVVRHIAGHIFEPIIGSYIGGEKENVGSPLRQE